jgi:hypothetical protein
MRPTSLDPEDVDLAIVSLAILGDLALRTAEPLLSYRLMHAALMISLGWCMPAVNHRLMLDLSSDPECSGPTRRCYAFVAAVLTHLGRVEPDETVPPPPKQLTLFP